MYGEVGFERQPGFVILPNPIGYSGGQIDVAWQSALRDELGRLHRVVRSQLHWAPTDDFKNLDSLAEWVQRGEVWWACKPKWAVSKFAYWLVISADLLLGGAARLFENNEVVSVSGLPALNLTPEHALGILSEYYEKVGHDEDIRKRWEVLAEAASGTFRSDKKWLVVNPQLFRRAADFSELPAAKRPGYALCPGTKIFTVEVFDLLKNSAMHSEVWAI